MILAVGKGVWDGNSGRVLFGELVVLMLYVVKGECDIWFELVVWDLD